MPGGRLHYGQPINRSYPTNRGLVAEWAVVPWYRSGPRCIDLAGKNHGTLTNGPTWSGAIGRQGGFGSLSFDGTDDYVALWDSSALPITGTLVSAACWIRPTGSLTGYQSVFDWGGGSLSRELSAFLGGAANHLFVAVGNTGGAEVTLSESWVANEWQHLAITCDGTTISVYRNGRSVGSTTSGIGSGMSFAAFQWGGNPSGGGAAYQGQQDDLAVFSRSLSAFEVFALFDQSRRGNPDRWSWLSDRAYLFAPPAAATVTAAPSLVFPGSGGGLPGIVFPGV